MEIAASLALLAMTRKLAFQEPGQHVFRYSLHLGIIAQQSRDPLDATGMEDLAFALVKRYHHPGTPACKSNSFRRDITVKNLRVQLAVITAEKQ